MKKLILCTIIAACSTGAVMAQSQNTKDSKQPVKPLATTMSAEQAAKAKDAKQEPVKNAKVAKKNDAVKKDAKQTK